MESWQQRLDGCHSLQDLQGVEVQCHQCGLRDGARGVVFGEGHPSSRIVFCGEGPGAQEDQQLRPFVGAAGKLLDQMMAAMGFDRERNAYILNVVKCRPPGNRAPTEAEQAACRPNLQAQLRVIQPAMMVLMGATAIGAMVDPAARVTKVHGQWVERTGIWMMPTFHPAALLRNPQWKRAAWDDLKKVIVKYREMVDGNHLAPAYPMQ